MISGGKVFRFSNWRLTENRDKAIVLVPFAGNDVQQNQSLIRDKVSPTIVSPIIFPDLEGFQKLLSCSEVKLWTAALICPVLTALGLGVCFVVFENAA